MSLLTSLDALLTTNPTNIRYLTGFVGVAPEEREAYLLLTKNKTYLFTNSLYLEQAKNLSLKVVEISREKPLSKELRRLITKLSLKRLGFEEEDLRFSEYQTLIKELKGTTLVATKNRVEELRMIKRDDEIQNIRAAAKLTDQGFDYILGKLKPGVTETEIAWEIEAFFRKRGAEIAFSPIVAFNKNSSQPHYQSVNREALTVNSLVLLDFGARVKGYCADMTRVVFIGKPKAEWKSAYQAVLEAQLAALIYLDKNKDPSGAKADKIARNIIKKSRFVPYSHSLGHNVGLAIHETPRLTSKKDVILKPGMVFSVEPGIYKEGQYGIRLEDLVLLKRDGIEILTTSAKKLLTL